jgi:predicted  nucleic acid-binding Zn-ribbon protein
MANHFEDAKYYMGRAAEHAKAGVKEELEPLEERVRELTGNETEEEPEPSRLERLQQDLKDLEERVEGEASEAVKNARGRLLAYREDREDDEE